MKKLLSLFFLLMFLLGSSAHIKPMGRKNFKIKFFKDRRDENQDQKNAFIQRQIRSGFTKGVYKNNTTYNVPNHANPSRYTNQSSYNVDQENIWQKIMISKVAPVDAGKHRIDVIKRRDKQDSNNLKAIKRKPLNARTNTRTRTHTKIIDELIIQNSKNGFFPMAEKRKRVSYKRFFNEDALPEASEDRSEDKQDDREDEDEAYACESDDSSDDEDTDYSFEKAVDPSVENSANNSNFLDPTLEKPKRNPTTISKYLESKDYVQLFEDDTFECNKCGETRRSAMKNALYHVEFCCGITVRKNKGEGYKIIKFSSKPPEEIVAGRDFLVEKGHYAKTTNKNYLKCAYCFKEISDKHYRNHLVCSHNIDLNKHIKDQNCSIVKKVDQSVLNKYRKKVPKRKTAKKKKSNNQRHSLTTVFAFQNIQQEGQKEQKQEEKTQQEKGQQEPWQEEEPQQKANSCFCEIFSPSTPTYGQSFSDKRTFCQFQEDLENKRFTEDEDLLPEKKKRKIDNVEINLDDLPDFSDKLPIGGILRDVFLENNNNEQYDFLEKNVNFGQDFEGQDTINNSPLYDPNLSFDQDCFNGWR